MSNIVVLVGKYGNPNHWDPVVDSFIDPIGPTMSNKSLRQGMAWNREGEVCVTAAVPDCVHWGMSTANYPGKCTSREGNSPDLWISIRAWTLSFHTFIFILMQCVNQHIPPDYPRVT